MTPNLKLIRAVPLFQGFTDDDLRDLASRAGLRSVRAGETLFRLGDPGTSMFIILGGVVEVVLPAPEAGSDRTVLQRLGPGDFFGEMALLDNQPRMAGVEAVADAELMEFTRDSLMQQLQRSPQLVPAMLRVMSNRLRIAAQLLGTTTARNINQEADERLTWAERLADSVARANGSWGFMLALAGLAALWILGNGWERVAFDPFPYQLFNLLLALLVALQGPLIMMSQNRQVMKERLHAEADYLVNLKNETGIHRILHELGELRHEIAALRAERDGAAAGSAQSEGVQKQ